MGFKVELNDLADFVENQLEQASNKIDDILETYGDDMPEEAVNALSSLSVELFQAA